MAKVSDVVAATVKSLKLELNQEEIRFLCDLFNNIGGSPVDSRRKISAGIREAMRVAGVDVEPKCPNDLCGNIVFKDVPKTKAKPAVKTSYKVWDSRYDYEDDCPF